MFQYIEKLRAKPDNTKKQIAFIVALFISGIIFVIWLSVIYPDWRDGEVKKTNTAKVEPSPLSGFAQNFGEGFSGIKEQFSKIKETFSSFSVEPEYYKATSTTDPLPNSIE